ncbi:MAG TPA: RDD family protein [Planctomycetaceae bacterium]|nr:RDD family protein [Planctomycetaceae bacterium]
MADAVELTDDAFTADESAPPGFRSEAGRSTLFMVVFGTAFPLLILQFVAPQFLAVGLMPQSTPSIFNLRIESAMPGQAVWWENRLWVMVNVVAPGSPQVTALRAINDDGQWDRQSDIPLPVPFDSALVDGDRLLLVSSHAVTAIQQRQARRTYPRVKLNQPSQPFLHQGRLCVIDRVPGQADPVWYDYLEGEWAERGTIAMPAEYQAAFAGQPVTTTITRPTRRPGGMPFPMPAIVSGMSDPPWITTLPDGRIWIAVAEVNDPSALWVTIEPPLSQPSSTNGDDAPVDALKLDDPSAIVRWERLKAPNDLVRSAATWNGDPVLIATTNYGPAFGASPARLQLHTLKDSEFVATSQLAGFGADAPVAIPKPDGTLVFVAASKLSPMGLQTVELSTTGFGAIRRVGDSPVMNTSAPNFWPLYLLMMQFPLMTATVLGIVAHVMVERHRDRRFSFGHHTVRLASIGRRGVARVIDAQLFSAPITITFLWLWHTGDLMGFIEQHINTTGFTTLLLWGVAIALGALLYLIAAVLFFGTLEGVWGLSPGKWLVGLRVVRTTFRPIGVFRGLIRQFLLVIDGFFSYFVAILMAACTAKSQRLGDLCADSIVVEQRTLPANWRENPVTTERS